MRPSARRPRERSRGALTRRTPRRAQAPVSGSKKPAEDGTLIIISAGDRALYDEMAACFDAMGKKHYFLGSTVGAGANCKLVVNMIMGTMMASLGEGMAIADRAGLDLPNLIEILGLGAMANPMFALKVPTSRTPAPSPDRSVAGSLT